MKPEESTSPEGYSYTFKVVPAEPEPTPPKDKNEAHYDPLTSDEADLKELSDAIYNLQKEYAAKIAQEIWNHIDLEDDTHDIVHAINLGLACAVGVVNGN